MILPVAMDNLARPCFPRGIHEPMPGSSAATSDHFLSVVGQLLVSHDTMRCWKESSLWCLGDILGVLSTHSSESHESHGRREKANIWPGDLGNLEDISWSLQIDNYLPDYRNSCKYALCASRIQ